MDASDSIKMLLGWDAYSPLTKFLVVAAPVLIVLAFVASIAASVFTASDQKVASDRATAEFGARLSSIQTTTKSMDAKLDALLKVQGAVTLGSVVDVDALPPGWSKKLSTGKTTTVEATSEDTMDFGPVEMKTVGVLNDAGKVDVLFRTIAILQSNRWASSTCMLEGEKNESDGALEAIFRTGHFAERLEFADDILAVGIASRQSASSNEALMTLTQKRAQRLSSALLNAGVIHHPQALYDLPLGGSKDAFEAATQDEAKHRTVLVVGVKKASTDTSLYSIIDEVIARGEFRDIGLSYFGEAINAKNLLKPSVVGKVVACATEKHK